MSFFSWLSDSALLTFREMFPQHDSSNPPLCVGPGREGRLATVLVMGE